MAGLSVAHSAVIAQLVEHCSDPLLAKLAETVSTLPGAKAAAIAGMLNEAAIDRLRRNAVFSAILPLFANRADGVTALSFPAQVLPRLWKAASSREPALLPALDDKETFHAVADRIGHAAAGAVRDQAELIWPTTLMPSDREAGLENLASCLDLLHLARRGLPSLQAWIGRPDGDQIAELRLLVRDAAAVSPDGASRIVEILFANLSDASLILRIVTQTSGAAGRESFLSASEMAGFVDRLIAGVNRRTQTIADLKPQRGLEGVEALIADVTWCAGVVTELDVTLSLQPDSAWGKSVREARVRVAGQLVNLLKAADKAVDAALPMGRMQLTARMTRMAPKMDAPYEGAAMTAADTLLRLVGAVRGAAAVFGFESDRKKLVNRLTERLSTYADEALDLVNCGEADEAHGLKLIERAADFLVHLDATEAARTVRRRAAVAGVAPVNAAPSEAA